MTLEKTLKKLQDTARQRSAPDGGRHLRQSAGRVVEPAPGGNRGQMSGQARLACSWPADDLHARMAGEQAVGR
ncbi:hypothetical protein [Amycolatopsis sp. NPDC004079]|uniref:hypothetical protein n=1 Tax=Amycolatopsis sp. NPDC004079 TaxID=3154549 RepID=UPI0033B5A1F6